jgi:hypothetical protein
MNATTKVIALATAAALSIAGVAGAHRGHHAKVYGAKLAKMAAATDPAYVKLAGRAHLVDGRKHNPLVVHVRHLKPNTAYTFELSTATCEAASAPVADYAITSQTSNAAGKLRAKTDSDTFEIADGATYFVVVKEGTTTIACGPLNDKHGNGTFKLKKPKKSHKSHKHHQNDKPTARRN